MIYRVSALKMRKNSIIGWCANHIHRKRVRELIKTALDSINQTGIKMFYGIDSIKPFSGTQKIEKSAMKRIFT